VGGKRSNADLAAGEVKKAVQNWKPSLSTKYGLVAKGERRAQDRAVPNGARGLNGKQVGNKKGAGGNYIIG